MVKGFNKYARNFTLNFTLLDENLDSNSKGVYYAKWKKRYDSLPRNNKKTIEWDIRNRKSLKEIATSATFFVEAECVRKSNCYSAYYFLCYYSLFHAMLSTLYLVDDIDIEDLVELSHQKVQNIFVNNFQTKKNPIISIDIENHFILLKSLREYYSYSMPMNEFFSEKQITNPFDFLEDDIKQCFQLTSLHSLILDNSYNDMVGYSKLNVEEKSFFINLFTRVNAKKHPFEEKYIFDPADKNVLNEIRSGHSKIGINHIGIDLEHFIDEFRTYNTYLNDDSNNGIDILKIDSLIYSIVI